MKREQIKPMSENNRDVSNSPLFSNKDLKAMIVPLFFEQLLVLLVGIVDTFMISSAGEAAVSGVSLVNNFSAIFMFLFTALSSGGAVIVSQYIGSGQKPESREAAGQLLMISTAVSIAIMAVVLLGGRGMLGLLFGRVEEDVMRACVTYLWISALSYPALAVYNSGAALYRSLGDTRTTMVISIASNLINVAGNYIGVFVLRAGVAGVAWPTFAARLFSAVVITALAYGKKHDVYYETRYIFRWNGDLLKKIMRVAVPNGLEGAIFQFVKVALSSIVALFGTYQIAANGVAQSIWSLAALTGIAMGPVFVTVIGQCMGAGEVEQAERYFYKLLKISILFAVAWNALILAGTPLLLRYYSLSEETKALTFQLVVIHNLFCALVSPFGGIGNGLRAAGDIKFTMITSIAATILVRLVFSYLLGQALGWGVIGIAWAMCFNWVASAIAYFIRLGSGKWKQFKII